MKVTVSKGMESYDVPAKDIDEALNTANELYDSEDFKIKNVVNGSEGVISSFHDMLVQLDTITDELFDNIDFYDLDEEEARLLNDIGKIKKKIDDYLK